jgi:hypothetical protein
MWTRAFPEHLTFFECFDKNGDTVGFASNRELVKRLLYLAPLSRATSWPMTYDQTIDYKKRITKDHEEQVFVSNNGEPGETSLDNYVTRPCKFRL